LRGVATSHQIMASAEELNFNDSHKPHENAVQAFNHILPTIKAEIIKSRHHWDKHEPRMWSRASSISDHTLVNFTIEDDLVLVRSAFSSYGTIILGKICLPAVNDNEGKGYVHVRIHDSGASDVKFHSLFTEEVRPDFETPPTDWRAVHTEAKPLEFFNE